MATRDCVRLRCLDTNVSLVSLRWSLVLFLKCLAFAITLIKPWFGIILVQFAATIRVAREGCTGLREGDGLRY